MVFESHAFNPNVEDGECCLSFFSLFFSHVFFWSPPFFADCWWFRVGEGTRKRDFFLCVPFCDFMCTHTRGISFLFGTNHHHHHNLSPHTSFSLPCVVRRPRARVLFIHVDKVKHAERYLFDVDRSRRRWCELQQHVLFLEEDDEEMYLAEATSTPTPKAWIKNVGLFRRVETESLASFGDIRRGGGRRRIRKRK